jgi:uncharacterized membrane protein YkoI
VLQKAQKFTMAVAAVFAIAVGSAVIANAASSSGTATAGSSSAAADSAATGQQGARPPGGPGRGETALTGETADKVTAAAKAKVPGGTVLRVETDAGDAAYEAHVRKSDGTEVIVLVNKDFEVTAVQEAGPGGPGGRGGHDGRPCDRDGDGNPDSGSSGSDSGSNQGTGFDDSSSSNQI